VHYSHFLFGVQHGQNLPATMPGLGRDCSKFGNRSE